VRRLLAIAACCVFLITGGTAARATDSLPGFNVHLVRNGAKGRFWRGGAPKKETLQALSASARARGVKVTLFDLRSPAMADDRSRKGGRLSPVEEAALAAKLGLRYVAINALNRELPARIREALREGDVYIHCMYGVNRTGFAVARYARAAGVEVSRKGLGARDWKQGTAFQARQ
jgi:hypothetical protein